MGRPSLDLAILGALRDIGDRMMPEGLLLQQVRLTSVDPVTAAQLNETLKRLEGRGEVRGYPNEDTGTRWKLADEGRDRLQSAGV